MAFVVMAAPFIYFKNYSDANFHSLSRVTFTTHPVVGVRVCSDEESPVFVKLIFVIYLSSCPVAVRETHILPSKKLPQFNGGVLAGGVVNKSDDDRNSNRKDKLAVLKFDLCT